MKLESAIQRDVRDYLRSRGWWVEVFSCNAFQQGIPDLIAYRDQGNTVRWIDIKRPQGGTLTKAQTKKWDQWQKIGVGVWILTGCDDTPLYGPPNWRDWWKPRYSKYLAKPAHEILREMDKE